jgi:hypothetical protein
MALEKGVRWNWGKGGESLPAPRILCPLLDYVSFPLRQLQNASDCFMGGKVKQAAAPPVNAVSRSHKDVPRELSLHPFDGEDLSDP